MMPIAMNRPLFGDPPEVKLRRPSFRGIHVFVSGSSWDWFRPINAGDQLFSFGGTESVVEKESEFAERSLQLTKTMVRFNQRAEIVAISRTLLIHTERKTAREKGKYDDDRTGHLHRRRHRRDRRDLRRRAGPGERDTLVRGRRRSATRSPRWPRAR